MLPKRRSSDSLVDEIKNNNVSCYEQVGKGVLSTAYSCYYKDGKSAVIKIINTDEEGSVNNVIREIFVLKTIDATGGIESIVKLQAFDGNDFGPMNFYMMFDRYDNNLDKFLLKKTLAFRARLFKDFVKDMSEALNFLHDLGFYHLDIKPDNILVNNVYTNSLNRSPRSVTFCLADFSHSVHVDAEENKKFAFTPIITPPEYYCYHLIKKDSKTYYNEKSDIWCLGIVFIYFITGEFLYDLKGRCETQTDIFKRIMSLGDYPTYMMKGEKVNLIKHTTIFHDEERLHDHVDIINNCLYFHQEERSLPDFHRTSAVPYLQIVSTLKYGLTIREVKTRWYTLRKMKNFFKNFDETINLYFYFVYNYDTLFIKTNRIHPMGTAITILRILLRVLYEVCDKDLDYLIKTEFGDVYKKNSQLYQNALESFIIPPILMEESKKKPYFVPSEKKLYIIVK